MAIVAEVAEHLRDSLRVRMRRAQIHQRANVTRSTPFDSSRSRWRNFSNCAIALGESAPVAALKGKRTKEAVVLIGSPV